MRRFLPRVGLVLLGMALGISATYLIAHAIRLHEGCAELQAYARRLILIGERISAEDDLARASVADDKLPFCSDQELAFMRDYVFRSAHIRDIGRTRNDKLYCTTGVGRLPRPLPMKPADIYSNGLRIYIRTPILISPATSGMIIAKDDVNIVLNPDAIHVLDEQPKFYGAFLFDRRNNVIKQNFGPPIPLTPGEIAAGRLIERNGVFYQPLCSETTIVCRVAAEARSDMLSSRGGLFVGFLAGGPLLGVALALIFILFQNRELSVERQLRRALRRGDLSLLYQPIVNLDTRAIVGAEALVRWVNESGEVVRPESFVVLAEERGFVGQITSFVMHQSVVELGDLLSSGTFKVSINITSQDLASPAFFEDLQHCIHAAGISASAVGLELTERSVADSPVVVFAVSRLIGAGHEVYIDDFGTGYSSLAYLHQLDASAIKIDKVFTQTVGTGSVTASVVPQILDMAAKLGLLVVVEGIETEEQVNYFRAARPGLIGQGWLFGRPMQAAQLRAAIAAGVQLAPVKHVPVM